MYMYVSNKIKIMWAILYTQVSSLCLIQMLSIWTILEAFDVRVGVFFIKCCIVNTFCGVLPFKYMLLHDEKAVQKIDQ